MERDANNTVPQSSFAGAGSDSSGVNSDTTSASPCFVKPNVHPPAHFNASDGDTAEGWKLWKQMWENYSILTSLDRQPQEYQTALLLHCLGPDGVRVYNGLKFDSDEQSKVCTVILTKLDAHFLGERREFFERFKFNKRSQEPGETVEQYITALRTMSKSCGFCDCMKDKLLMDRLLLGVRDDRMREQMMAMSDLTLSKAIIACKAVEATTAQMSALKQEEVHQLSRKQVSTQRLSQKTRNIQLGKAKGQPQSQSKRCKFCCGTHPMKKELCPAWGKKCNACGAPNHFRNSKLCPSNKVNSVNDGYDSDSTSSAESISCVTDLQGVYSIGADGPIMCNMNIHGKSVPFQIDSGATVNLLPKKHLISDDVVRPEPVKLQMWNKSTLSALGKCKVKTRNPANGKSYKVDFVIVEEDLTPLISKRAAEQMGLITVNYSAFHSVNQVSSTLADFPGVFSSSSVGTLPGPPVHLTVMEEASPTIRPARVIPESLKPSVKEELDSLQKKGIIDVVSEPTDWVHQMAVGHRKSGKVRLCLDPRPLNPVLKREHYPLPVLDDILPQLAGASVFSICDLKDGYLHCPLDTESSLLTTFATPWGRYRWKRLPFGLKVSSEIFQKRLHQALDGLEGVRCVADDIIIWGSSNEEHDQRLVKLLERCQTVGIVLNQDKCQFRLKQINFLGHVVSSSGLKPDPDKIEAILKMTPPECPDDIHRLRGMVNYLARYLPRLSDVMRPLNELTHKDTPWSWSAEQDNAFAELKQILVDVPVLAYYDQKKDLVIHTDASAKGIGAVMIQDGQPIAYASRSLNDTEGRYSVIEKEMLAVVFALEKWNQYTFGRKVTLYSDHKPLESISRKPLDRAPKRLQGMLLRALAYDVDIHYLKGSDNLLADPLSRASLPYEKGQEDFEVVNAVSHLSLPDEKLLQIRQHTADDPGLRALKETVLNGWPEHKSQVDPQVKPFFNFRDEIAIHDGLIFRGDRLIIPQASRKRVMRDLHIGHCGIEGTLRRARVGLYWPNMTKDITEWIQKCEACMELSTSQPPQPLMSHEIPERPWEKIGVDLFSLEGKEYMVTVCYKSNFWELDSLSRTTAPAVIARLKSHFARYGIPDTIVSDNGPPFSSQEFHSFVTELGIQHQTSAPYNSKANGKAESAVKTAKRTLKKCRRSGEEITVALLNIRNTPSQGVDTSPAQRFLGRRTKTITPMTHDALLPRHQSKDEMSQLKANQQRQSRYFDRKARVLAPLSTGDVVRMKPFRPGEDRWKKATVTRRLDERSYELQRHGVVYRRNREHLRLSKESSDPQHVIMVPTPEAGEDAHHADDDQGVQPRQPVATPGDSQEHRSPGRHRERTQPGSQRDGPRRSTRDRRPPITLRDFMMY